MKRIAILIENLLTDSGGAEKFGLKLAEVLSCRYDVTVICRNGRFKPEEVFRKYNSPSFPLIVYKSLYDDNKIIKTLDRLRLRLILKKSVCGKFDLYINATLNRDIGLPAIKNIHLIHFPRRPYKTIIPWPLGSMLDKYYRTSYDLLIANSLYTKQWIKKYWDLDSTELNPPIDMPPVSAGVIDEKEKLIITVGRFSPEKKLEVMAEAFVNGIYPEHKDWRLVIAGNISDKEEAYYEKLKNFEMTCPGISVKGNLQYSELLELYKRAAVYWHANGYGNKNGDPLYSEHFGMTTAEAMTQGCVPVVVDKAGQREIVDNDVNGFRWNTLEKLTSMTKKLINDPGLRKRMAENAVAKSERYGIKFFSDKAVEVIGDIIEG